MADITDLLNSWSAGNSSARDELMPLVYDGIRKIARNLLRNERAGITLNSTALAHEVYLKLVDQERVSWQGRTHFFRAASNAMRRILVDEARRRLAAKRGADAPEAPLQLALNIADEPDREVLALHDALDDLEREHPDAAKVVELRYFCGLSFEQAAEVLGVTVHAVRRDWTLAKAWLARRLCAAQ